MAKLSHYKPLFTCSTRPCSNMPAVDFMTSIPGMRLVGGPLLIGLCLNWTLLGVAFVQVYIYYIMFPNDRWFHKALVYGTLALSCTQSFMLMGDGFYYVIDNWGNLFALNQINLGWFSVPIMDGVIALVVDLTFAWRTWVLSNSSVPLTSMVALIAFFPFGTSLSIGIQAKLLPGLLDMNSTRTSIIIWFASTCSVNVIIATTMTILLLRPVSGTIGHTRTMVQRALRLILESGTLIASVSALGIILFLGSPNNLITVCPAIVIGKIYANTMFAIYNNRARAPEQTKCELCSGEVRLNIVALNDCGDQANMNRTASDNIASRRKWLNFSSKK